jgi:hypothetical protein
MHHANSERFKLVFTAVLDTEPTYQKQALFRQWFVCLIFVAYNSPINARIQTCFHLRFERPSVSDSVTRGTIQEFQ